MLFLLGSWNVLFFLFCLICGVFLVIGSDSWIGVWCGLELNLMGFVPMVCSAESRLASETALKYFLVQAFGSSLFIMGAFTLFVVDSAKVVCISLFVKMGAAPFHFWFPVIMEGLDWWVCLILMTVQKIGPLMLICCLLSYNVDFIMFCVIILSAVVGSVGGVNQVLLRSLMAYSSIGHLSWMLMSVFISEVLWFLYFVLYCLVTVSVVLFFNFFKVRHLSQLVLVGSGSWELVAFLGLLSLGGLPPFIGFLPKWLVFQQVCGTGCFMCLVVLFLGGVLTLYYYMRIAVVGLLLSAPTVKWSFSFKGEGLLVFIVFINFFGLLFSSLVFSLL